jgi:hypothetical protein
MAVYFGGDEFSPNIKAESNRAPRHLQTLEVKGIVMGKIILEI